MGKHNIWLTSVRTSKKLWSKLEVKLWSTGWPQCGGRADVCLRLSISCYWSQYRGRRQHERHGSCAVGYYPTPKTGQARPKAANPSIDLALYQALGDYTDPLHTSTWRSACSLVPWLKLKEIQVGRQVWGAVGTPLRVFPLHIVASREQEIAGWACSGERNGFVSEPGIFFRSAHFLDMNCICVENVRVHCKTARINHVFVWPYMP